MISRLKNYLKKKPDPTPRGWCPACRGTPTEGLRAKRVREYAHTQHCLCECGVITHWFLGAPVIVLLGYSHWRHRMSLNDPNWGEWVPIHCDVGTLYHAPLTHTSFIYIPDKPLLVFPGDTLPRYWQKKDPIIIEVGFIIKRPTQATSLLFNAHTFTEVSNTWLNIENVAPTASNGFTA